MHYQVEDAVFLNGAPGRIAALVRGDDDPRKCVPAGYRFFRRGDIPEREGLTYLVHVRGTRALKWSHGAKLLPHLPIPASPTQRRGSVLKQAQSISDGTMAALTGLSESVRLTAMRQRFCQLIIVSEGSAGARFASWIDAWRWFVNGPAGDELPAYETVDRLYVRAFTGALPAHGRVWRAPVETTWISQDERPFALEEAQDKGWFGDPSWSLIRVGFVRRHWLAGRVSESFAAWAAAAQK